LTFRILKKIPKKKPNKYKRAQARFFSARKTGIKKLPASGSKNRIFKINAC
jgi:hypothetical protein